MPGALEPHLRARPGAEARSLEALLLHLPAGAGQRIAAELWSNDVRLAEDFIRRG